MKRRFFSNGNTRNFELGILFSSLDSFHGFTKIATYAPFVSIIFFAIFYIKLPRKYKVRLNRAGIAVFYILVIAILYSLYVGIKRGDYHGFMSFIVQLFLALICAFSFLGYFKYIRNRYHGRYKEVFADMFVRYSLPILIIGCVELLIIWKPAVYEAFVSLFSSRVTASRLQLISAEPSWATRLLLIFLCLLPLSTVSIKKKRALTVLALILLAATGSAYGILCVAIYYAVTYCSKRYFKYGIITISMVIIMFPLFLRYTNDYTRQRFEVLSELSTSDLETIAVGAGSMSVFLRLGNPVLGLDMGFSHPLFGVGGGYYYANYADAVAERFPLAEKTFTETEAAGSTAKNLFSRVAAEFGMIVLFLLIIYLTLLYKKQYKNNKWIKGPFVAMLVLTLNFDNLYHLYPLLLFCFIFSAPTKRLCNDNYAKNQNIDHSASVV